jgi:hypothetical protein
MYRAFTMNQAIHRQVACSVAHASMLPAAIYQIADADGAFVDQVKSAACPCSCRFISFVVLQKEERWTVSSLDYNSRELRGGGIV